MAYYEYRGNDVHIEVTRSFTQVVDLKAEGVALFGWIVFPSKEVRDSANENVPKDSRITKLLATLNQGNKAIFDAKRMVMVDLMYSSSNKL